MPSTYTSSNRFEKPGQFEQDSTWGLTANTDFDLIDAAISGVGAIALSDANYTLTSNNGATDQARNAALIFSGTLTATRTITIPTTAKIYLVSNTTAQALVFSRGAGSTATVPAGLKAVVVNDGSNVFLWSTNTTDAATLNGQAGSFYQNANNLNAGTVPLARLSAGTTGAAGILQITDSVASTSTTTAASPNSVKTANDNAVTAQGSATSAVNTANAASVNATNAVNTANTALGNATTALNTANTAQTTANNAVSAAGTAQGSANTAQATANSKATPPVAVMAASGYFRDPNTGFILQWGTITAGPQAVTFAVAFPTVCYSVTFGSNFGNGVPRYSALTVNGFSYSAANDASTGATYMAVGR